MKRLVQTAFVICLTVGLMPGCGSGGPTMGRVSGKVTYKGAPVAKGTITFVSKNPENRNATGQIGGDGSYTLQTFKNDDGAIVGDYSVTIYARDEVILDYIPQKPVPPKYLAPAKYETADSGLTATVKKGSNTINFDLAD